MHVTIDGRPVEVDAGTTVLEAIRADGGNVPTLCFDDRQVPFGACRVCLVAAEGARGPIPACTTPCRDGLSIDTQSAAVQGVVRTIVELVLSELPVPPAPHTELAAVAAQVGAAPGRWSGAVHHRDHDASHPYLAFQHELCISCGRCVRACDEVQGAFALTATGRGFSANVTAGLDAGFRNSTCVSCGACADTCPTDAITEITLLALNSSSSSNEGDHR
jgi:predicted molibdopterin-dependent oxidoreductase YjgC